MPCLWSTTTSMFLTALSNYSPHSVYFCSWIILCDFIILLFICYPGFRLFGLFSKIIFNFKVVLYHSCFSYNTEIHKYSILSPKLLMKILKNIKPIMKLWHCSITFFQFWQWSTNNLLIYLLPVIFTFILILFPQLVRVKCKTVSMLTIK